MLGRERVGPERSNGSVGPDRPALSRFELPSASILGSGAFISPRALEEMVIAARAVAGLALGGHTAFWRYGRHWQKAYDSAHAEARRAGTFINRLIGSDLFKEFSLASESLTAFFGDLEKRGVGITRTRYQAAAHPHGDIDSQSECFRELLAADAVPEISSPAPELVQFVRSIARIGAHAILGTGVEPPLSPATGNGRGTVRSSVTGAPPYGDCENDVALRLYLFRQIVRACLCRFWQPDLDPQESRHETNRLVSSFPLIGVGFLVRATVAQTANHLHGSVACQDSVELIKRFLTFADFRLPTEWKPDLRIKEGSPAQWGPRFGQMAPLLADLSIVQRQQLEVEISYPHALELAGIAAVVAHEYEFCVSPGRARVADLRRCIGMDSSLVRLIQTDGTARLLGFAVDPRSHSSQFLVWDSECSCIIPSRIEGIEMKATAMAHFDDEHPATAEAQLIVAPSTRLLPVEDADFSADVREILERPRRVLLDIAATFAAEIRDLLADAPRLRSVLPQLGPVLILDTQSNERLVVVRAAAAEYLSGLIDDAVTVPPEELSGLLSQYSIRFTGDETPHGVRFRFGNGLVDPAPVAAATPAAVVRADLLRKERRRKIRETLESYFGGESARQDEIEAVWRKLGFILKAGNGTSHAGVYEGGKRLSTTSSNSFENNQGAWFDTCVHAIADSTLALDEIRFRLRT